MTLLASDQRRAPSLEPVKLPPVGVDTSYPLTARPILREGARPEPWSGRIDEGLLETFADVVLGGGEEEEGRRWRGG